MLHFQHKKANIFVIVAASFTWLLPAGSVASAQSEKPASESIPVSKELPITKSDASKVKANAKTAPPSAGKQSSVENEKNRLFKKQRSQQAERLQSAPVRSRELANDSPGPPAGTPGHVDDKSRRQ